MKGIAINGFKLHEVMMLLEPYGNGTISYLRYPKTQIKFYIKEQEVKIMLPPFLALELYRANILPRNEAESFPVQVSGKKIGTYKIKKLLYPNFLCIKR